MAHSDSTGTMTETSNAGVAAPASERLDFVNRANAEYIDQLYEQYQRDPRSVDELAGLFRRLRNAGGRGFVAASGTEPAKSRAALTLGVHNLVHSYRELGHFVANLDPLGHDRPSHPLLDLSEFGLTAADLDRDGRHRRLPRARPTARSAT